MDIPLQSILLIVIIVAVPLLLSGALIYGHIREGRIMGAARFPFFQSLTRSFWYSTGMPKYVSRKHEPIDFWFGFAFRLLPIIGMLLLLMLMGVSAVLGLTFYELLGLLF